MWSWMWLEKRKGKEVFILVTDAACRSLSTEENDSNVCHTEFDLLFKLLSKFIMWDVLLLFSSICTAVVVGAQKTVTGHRGERVEIRCSYKSGYESNSKYFCKGDCLIIGFKNIMVESGSPAKDERFSLTDDTTNRVFTVTITDLRTEDEGQYWCVVERTITDLSFTDVYSEILLQVKQDKKTTEVSTISPFSTDLNQSGHVSHPGSVIYICVGLVIMVILFLIALTVLCKQKKSKNLPKVTQLGLSQHVSVELLPLNTTAKITAEDSDWNDHNYQEISEFQCKNQDISTIYTTAESPDDSHIYSTADAPDGSNKPDYPTIYSTADNPEDSTIYSIADKLDDFTIYSAADKPDSTVYSTVDNPVSTIYSKAESPDDPMIFSTSYWPDDPMIFSTSYRPDDPMIFSTSY